MRVALYGTGVLLLLIVVYLLFSYSVAFGGFLIGLSVLVVLLIRKTRGTQTSIERQVFEKAGQHGESARRAYEEGKHKEFAQNAYQQSKKVYEEANTRYKGWSEARATEQERSEGLRAAERERNQPRREVRPGAGEPTWATLGDAADVVSGSPLVSAYPPRECIDRAEAYMTVRGYAVQRGGSTATIARDRQINWVVFLVLLLFGVLPGLLYLAMLAVAPVRTTLVTMPSAGGTELVIRSDGGEDAAVLEGWIKANLLAGSPR